MAGLVPVLVNAGPVGFVWSTPVQDVEPQIIPGVLADRVTVILAVAVAVLNGLVPPLVLVSTLVPTVPPVRSQARKVTEAVVSFAAPGTKRAVT